MPSYKYKVRERYGKQITGVMGGESQAEVSDKLKKMGYTPISIQPAPERLEKVAFLDRFGKVRLSDLNVFTRQLVTLLKAGIPLLTAIKACREQTGSRVLKNTLGSAARDIEGGSSLADALEKHPRCFNELYVNMIRSAEAGGVMDEVLERLADLGEYDEDTRNRIETATRYPIMVVCALIIGFFIVITLVIPRFAKVFGQFNVALPFPTRVLIGIDYIVKHFWFLMILGVFAAIFGFFAYIRTPKGRAQWDAFKLKIPIVGPLVLKFTMSRFARVTGTLVRSGLPILQILELTSRNVGNTVVSRAIENIKISVSEGKGMAEPMRVSKIFPPIVIQMVSVGEETGKMDELLLRVSDYYDSQINYAIKNLSIMIEPVLLVVLGCGVLFMALAIFLPMWNLMSLFRR